MKININFIKIISAIFFLGNLLLLNQNSAFCATMSVILNKENSLKELKADKVKPFYLLQKKNWPGRTGVKIEPVDNTGNSTMRAAFAQKVLDLANESDLDRELIAVTYSSGQSVHKHASDKEVIAAVASKPGAIGFVLKASVDSSVLSVLDVDF